MFVLVEKPTVSQCVLFRGKTIASYLPIKSVFDYATNELPECDHDFNDRGECSGGMCQWLWLVNQISQTAKPADIQKYVGTHVPDVLIEDFTSFGVKKNYLSQIIDALADEPDDLKEIEIQEAV